MVATACTTGAHAIGAAFRPIQGGICEAMIRGGAERDYAARGRRVRGDAGPVAAKRRPRGSEPAVGVIGRVRGRRRRRRARARRIGSAVRRGAPILAEIVGYGMSADAHHLTTPPEDGDGVARVMVAALEDADLGPATSIT